ncbi:hypothetical protein BG28_07260 [Nesterenkonia sp. AN1]|uniref:Uncharacterized protein n=1 Tax=Nesterenkonia aurantiaca TaxID=1436010 RepID=A0A4R7G5U2_9MICC|nr:hypothetical protein [Nesterenkonia]EXF24237.1 hypothetical protein BG28_07260 [Nesterenkonia sp. AN1]TDS86853.1 hypothetical protein EV640_102148 [Nesterenkonia aurantiaca]
MTTTPPVGSAETDRSSTRRHVLAWSLFVILGSAGAWFGWMAWDQEYQVDPVTGMEHGPYEAWQVIGCGITLLLIALWTSRSRWWLTVLLLPPSFTVAWSLTAAAEDSTGLWLVGAMLVGIGSTLGTVVVLGITRLTQVIWRQRRSAAAQPEPLPPPRL